MENYRLMKARQAKEEDKLFKGVYFDEEQKQEMLKKWDMTEDDVLCLGPLGNWVIARRDFSQFLAMKKRHKKEIADAIASDKTGYEFIAEMFCEELENNGYLYTHDISDTLHALKMDKWDLAENPALAAGLGLAITMIS